MKIILIFVLIFLFIQKNQANNNAADYFKSLKYKDFRDRVYNMNAKHNQGIWFRIGKRSNNHDLKFLIKNSHVPDLLDYENFKDKLLNIDLKIEQRIKTKSNIKPKSFRNRVYNMNAKYNQGIWFRIG
jgi:hypothetical protein